MQAMRTRKEHRGGWLLTVWVFEEPGLLKCKAYFPSTWRRNEEIGCGEWILRENLIGFGGDKSSGVSESLM
jgi:hypothetical protein